MASAPIPSHFPAYVDGRARHQHSPRYLVQDNPIPSPKATEIIERPLPEEKPGFVSIAAMVEAIYVLDRAYRLATNEIAAAVLYPALSDYSTRAGETAGTSTTIWSARKGSKADAHALASSRRGLVEDRENSIGKVIPRRAGGPSFFGDGDYLGCKES